MTADDPMPLVAHLRELRDRFRNAIIAVFVAFLGLFPFANQLYTYVSEPLRTLLPEGSSMIATEVTSPFLTPFKLSLVLAVFVAMPVILSQIWGFIAPGLYKAEKRIAVPLLASSVVLFYAGVAFAYYVVFPLLFGFFDSNFNRSRDRDNPRLYGGVMADITELTKFPSIVKGLSGYPIINCFVRLVSIIRIVWGSGMGFV